MKIAAVLLTLTAATTFAGEQHQITVHGRPAIFDPPPPLTSVAFVDIYAGTYTWTDEVLNPGVGSQVVMQGSCHQNIRLTIEEASALVAALQSWIMFPEEDLLLWSKTKSTHTPTPEAAIPSPEAKPFRLVR